MGPDQPFLHWAIYIDPNGHRETLQPYYPPTPPSGTHDYIFYIYPGRYIGNITHYPFRMLEADKQKCIEVGSFQASAATASAKMPPTASAAIS